MISGPPEWIDKITRKVLSLFSIKEVKTPLSFFFRVTSAIVILGTIGLWAIDTASRYQVLVGAAVMLLILTLTVSVFAWFRPKNLVYGETGHRAEAKLTFGTEKEEVSAGALATTPGIPNPMSLTAAEADALPPGGSRHP
jgi:hypothetical protein